MPHVDALGLDTSASELTGHVSLTFAEVLQIASKLRSRGPEVVPFGEPADGSAAPAPTAKDPSSGTIAQGAYSSSYAQAGEPLPPPPLPEELRVRLARAFALECGAGDSVPSSALRRALSAAGITVAPGAVHALLGTTGSTSVGDDRYVSWSEFFSIAARVAPHDPSTAAFYPPPDPNATTTIVPPTASALLGPPPPAASEYGEASGVGGGGKMISDVIVAAQELTLESPPMQTLTACLTATSAHAATEEPMPTRRSDAFLVDGITMPLDLAIVCTTSRALMLTVEYAGDRPSETLLGELSASRLQQAGRVAMAHGTPAIVPVTLTDSSYGDVKGELSLAIAPPSVAPNELTNQPPSIPPSPPGASVSSRNPSTSDLHSFAQPPAAQTTMPFAPPPAAQTMPSPSKCVDAYLTSQPPVDGYSIKSVQEVKQQRASCAPAAVGPIRHEKRYTAKSDLHGRNTIDLTAQAYADQSNGTLQVGDDVTHEARLQLAFDSIDIDGTKSIGKRELYDALRRGHPRHVEPTVGSLQGRAHEGV